MEVAVKWNSDGRRREWRWQCKWNSDGNGKEQ